MQLDQILKFFAKYIEQELGIVYAEHNYFQLQNRLEDIAKLVGAPSIEALYEQSKNEISGPFKQLLLDVATNNETSFFRDPKVFRAIESVVLKSASEFLHPGEKLRIWSAAASTGQEALSMAIMIKEFNAKEKTNIQFSILGTDISERALAKCNSRTYSQLEVQRGLPAPYMIKYFKKDDQDRWLASPDLSSLMEFKKLNLKSAFHFREKFHLILCRNVLIYQSVESKMEILGRMEQVLAPGGFLVLGAGESLMGLSPAFEQRTIDGALVYQKRDGLTRAA